MGIFDIFGWHGSHSNPEVRTSLSRKELETLFAETVAEMQFKKYAIQLCINRIASAMSLCTFETYDKSEKKTDHYWWKFNFEPNRNMNTHDFLYQIIYEMVHNDNGALVVQDENGDLVVAKSYNVVGASYLPNLYTNIELYGGAFRSTAREEDVLRFQLPNKEVEKVVDGLYKTYGKFIAIATESYIRDRSLKLVLEIDSLFDQTPFTYENDDGEEVEVDPIEEIMKNRFKNFFNKENTITPLEAGLTLKKIEGMNTKQDSTDSEELNDLLINVIDFTADAFGIPRGLLKGDVADVEAMTDNFITFAVRPLAKEIETEINRKLYGKDKVMKGTKLKVVTGTIQTFNIVSFASAADKIIAASIATPNEMREILEWEKLDNPYMDEIKETKNYQKLGYNENE